MRCPFCGKEDTQVKDSRASDDGATIRRRRLCSSCGSRFTTFERIQLRDLSVIKRNGKKIPFDRDKLMKSMLMALRKRQINDDDIEIIISDIVGEVLFVKKVESQPLINRANINISNLAQAAYLVTIKTKDEKSYQNS